MFKNYLKKLDQKKVSNFLYLTIVLLGLYLFHITYNKEGFANSVNSISRFEDLEAVSESVEDNNLIQNNNTILSNNNNNNKNKNNNSKKNKNSDNNTKNNDNSRDKENNKIPSYRRKVNLYFFTVPIFVVLLVIAFIYFGFGYQQTFAQNMMYPKYYMTVLAMIFFFILFMLNSAIEFVRSVAKKI